MGYWEDYEERNDYEEKQKIYNCYNPEKEKKIQVNHQESKEEII